jgi:hypothetical protein
MALISATCHPLALIESLFGLGKFPAFTQRQIVAGETENKATIVGSLTNALFGS